MWINAEEVFLLDKDGIVRGISCNEAETNIQSIMGTRIIEERAISSCKEVTLKAFQDALNGIQTVLDVGSIDDNNQVVWSKIALKPSPLPDTPVFLHARALPDSWGELSTREKEIINALHQAELNPKAAAKILGISLNTFNAHRRTISQKCKLRGVGDFWIFVERCR